mmetsp:Transcript_47256/g.86773  ORF Transcript_47256/g.86773 Transcript_47256/m.86773 type:complete len:226 (-) Transcript_47256:572-1249(-)
MSKWRMISQATVSTATFMTRFACTFDSLNSSPRSSSEEGGASCASVVFPSCLEAARANRSAWCCLKASSSAFCSFHALVAMPSSAWTAPIAPMKCKGMPSTLQAAAAANNPPCSWLASERPTLASIPGKSMPCLEATVAPAIVKQDVNFEVAYSGAPYLSTGPSSQDLNRLSLSVVHRTVSRVVLLIRSSSMRSHHRCTSALVFGSSTMIFINGDSFSHDKLGKA